MCFSLGIESWERLNNKKNKLSLRFQLNSSSLAPDFFEFQYLAETEYPLHVKKNIMI